MLPGYLNLDNISTYPIDKNFRNAYNLNIENNNLHENKDNTLYPLSEEKQYKILYDITQVKLSPPKIGDNLLPNLPVKITAPTYTEQSTGTYQTIANDNNDMIPNGYSVGTTSENTGYNSKLSDTAKNYSLTLEKFSNINNNFKYDIFYSIVFIIVIIIIIIIIKNIINKKI